MMERTIKTWNKGAEERMDGNVGLSLCLIQAVLLPGTKQGLEFYGGLFLTSTISNRKPIIISKGRVDLTRTYDSCY